MTYLDIGYNGAVNLGGVTQAPVVNLSSITIESGGLLTHWYNQRNAEDHKLNLTLNSMTINAGGKIDATIKGYPSLIGPGSATCTNTWSGGSYGGQGYNATAGCNGPPYGSYSAPINLGSGGYEYAGGGAVILNIANTLTVNGSIIAEGSQNANQSGGSGVKHLPDGVVSRGLRHNQRQRL